MRITKKSQFSGNVSTMDIPVTQQELDEFKKSEKDIQTFFPHLNDDEREFLMTGCTPSEWDSIFSDMD